MIRSLLLGISAFLTLAAVNAQVIITGTLVDKSAQQPLAGIRVQTSFPEETISDADGKFSIRHPMADDLVIRFFRDQETEEYHIAYTGQNTIDAGTISLNFFQINPLRDDLPTINLEENDDQSDVIISGLLQSGDDLFSQMTDFTFSNAGFNRRGLDPEYTDAYLNYLPVNDLESGNIFWNNWGGLNDVFRIDDDVMGGELAEWGFGGVSNTFNTDLRASSQWKQKRISYAVTNRNYRNRIMGTWSTGLLPSGWAVSLSGSRRWAQEGYVDGTFYDAWSYFGSVEKRFGDKHALNLVVLGAPYKRGGASPAIQEMYDLADNNYYNSYWGWQQGEKRSGRVYTGHQPMASLRYDFKINERLDLTAAAGYQKGKSALSTLDWYQANDPRPDYYRRLPSYVDDPALAAQMTDYLTSNPDLLQIQWDDLYQVNLNSDFTVEDVDGIEGNDVTGALSRYVMEDRISDIQKISGNVALQWQISDRSQLNGGIAVVMQDTRNYKEVGDLMGGEFYVDYDKFAEQDFPGNEDALQNDLLRPNRLVYEGDQFGWDYYAKMRHQSAWLSYTLNLPKWEFGLSGSVRNQVFWRDGQTQNGRFPDNSYGESEKYDFLLPSGKGLIRYKFDGRNYLTVSGMYAERGPTFRNAYLSPRTRDSVVDGLVAEDVLFGEVRYDLKAPYLKIMVSAFYINSKNAIESTSFYHDDLRTFVNFSLTQIDKEYTGIEAAVEYDLTPEFTVSAAATIGQYINTSRPLATVTQDNDGAVLLEDITVYANNLYVGGTPQQAFTGGLTYRSKKFWSLFLNVNLFQESWVNFNPIRRTEQAVDLVELE